MKTRLIGLTVFSSFLFALALPNELFYYGSPFLGLFCLSPFFMALTMSPSFGFASILGIIFGGLSTLLSNYWLLFFQDFAIWTLSGVVLGYMGYNALLAPMLYGLARTHPRYRPFILAMTWTVYEYFKSVGFLGYPWGLIAYPVHEILPFIQFIDITGLWGLSLLMSMINAVISEGLIWKCMGRDSVGLHKGSCPSLLWRSQLLFTAVLVALSFIYGLFRMKMDIPITATARILLIQQNIDPWLQQPAMESVRTNQQLSRQGLKEADQKPDLVVWSENSVLYPLLGNELFFKQNPKGDPLIPFFIQSDTYFLFGSPVVLDREKDTAMNSVLLVSPEGKVIDYYGKQHPVPMAESVPFWDVKFIRDFFSEVIGLRAVWTMGDRNTIFKLPLSANQNVHFATPICFEDAFSDLCRRFILEGADLWINLTNDYWSKTVSSEVQHYVVAKFRAVENKRVLIRSTNGGVTVIVGPKGEEIARLPLFTPAYLNARVPVFKEKKLTPYTRFGDYLPFLLMSVLFILILKHP